MQQMTPEQRAKNYAHTFPDFPPLTYDDRWLHGMWLLGQSYKGSGFYGAFPPKLLLRLQAIFPNEFRGRVLHLFSGSLDASVGGVRVDLNLGRDPPPDIFADAHQLPFANGTFDLIVADPPYFPADAKKYGTPMINRAKVFRECARVLKEGGHLIWLDARSPMHRKSEWLWWGIIGVSRSTNHIYRALTFYQRRKSLMSALSKKLTAASEKIAAAFAILLGEDEATVAEAMAAQKKNTKVRETGDDEDEAPAKRGPGRPKKAAKPADDDDDEDEKPAKKKGPKPPAEDDDDDDEDEDDDEDSKDIPKDAALADLSRDDLKKLAKANGIDPIGKNREDLTKLLQEKRDGKKGKSAKSAKAADDDDDDDDEDEAEEKPAKKKKKPADDDDDEDEAPAKKKKAKADEDDEDEKPGEDDYPKLKVMKADLEAFFKLNKDTLTAAGFFGGKVKKGAPKAPNTYDQVMGDVDLIKEAWADNIWPEIQSGNWKKMKAEADAMDDDEDDDE